MATYSTVVVCTELLTCCAYCSQEDAAGETYVTYLVYLMLQRIYAEKMCLALTCNCRYIFDLLVVIAKPRVLKHKFMRIKYG